MYIKKTHQQYLFIKEKDLKFSRAAWRKLLEKKIMEWRGSRSKNTVFQTVIETQNPVKDRGQLVEKVRFLFCASCDSTHKIEFAQQIHKNRGRVPRFLYFKREKVSEWELSDVRVLRSQNTDCRKNDSFSTVSSGRGTASAAFAFYSQSILSMLKITGRASSEQQVIISFSRFIQPFIIEPPCNPV